jgi:hypothetical protein
VSDGRWNAVVSDGIQQVDLIIIAARINDLQRVIDAAGADDFHLRHIGGEIVDSAERVGSFENK